MGPGYLYLAFVDENPGLRLPKVFSSGLPKVTYSVVVVYKRETFREIGRERETSM